MYYHVQIETSEKAGKSGNNRIYFELDKTDLSEIETRIIQPFIRKEEFQFDGYFLKHNEIRRIAIKQTSKSVEDLARYENDNMPSNILLFVSPKDILGYSEHAIDITSATFDNVRKALTAETSKAEIKKSSDVTSVFIVHGRDDHAKIDTARFVEMLGFKAIILHEQASGGQTIIEKIEANTDVGFAIVLYTPCDFGGLSGSDVQKPRARQNVVFEHGYLNGRLGRKNVCALVKGDVEVPNDIAGIVYIPLDTHGAWKLAVAKELRNSGYSVDMNKVI